MLVAEERKPKEEMTAEEAVRNLQSGLEQEASWGFLYRKLRGAVFSVLHDKCKDPSLADDLTEDVFAALPESIKRYDPDRSALSTWLCRGALNKLYDYWRRAEVEGRRALSYCETHPEKDTSPEALLRARLATERFWRCWNELPVHEKVIYHMHKVEGIPLPVLAAEFEIQLRRLKHYVAWANKRMRAAYQRLYPGSDHRECREE